MAKTLNNLSEWTDLDWAADQAKRDFFSTRKLLAERARSLGEDMMRLAERLEAGDNSVYTVNSSGEVQGKGPEVDRLCAVLTEQRKASERLQKLQEAQGQAG